MYRSSHYKFKTDNKSINSSVYIHDTVPQKFRRVVSETNEYLNRFVLLEAYLSIQIEPYSGLHKRQQFLVVETVVGFESYGIALRVLAVIDAVLSSVSGRLCSELGTCSVVSCLGMERVFIDSLLFKWKSLAKVR